MLIGHWARLLVAFLNLLLKVKPGKPGKEDSGFRENQDSVTFRTFGSA